VTRKKAQPEFFQQTTRNIFVAFWRSRANQLRVQLPAKMANRSQNAIFRYQMRTRIAIHFQIALPGKIQPFAIRDSPIGCQLDQNRDDERRSTVYPRAFEARSDNLLPRSKNRSHSIDIFINRGLVFERKQ